MAKAILMKGGRGGVSSDEVNARREHVVKGYTALTADSNDEPAEGLIEDRGAGAVAAFAIGREDWNHQIWATFRNGWYHRPPHPEGHEAYIFITYEALANLLGVDPSKMLQTLNVADRQGQIKEIDTGANNFSFNKSNDYGIDFGKGVFYIDLAHGNAYYYRGDGHPHTCIDAEKLGNTTADKVLPGNTFTSKNGVNVQGTMKSVDTADDGFNKNKSNVYGIDGFGRFYIDLAHGNAYYHRGDGSPHTCIDANRLGNADANSLLEGVSATSEKGIKFWGGIKRWICTTGDVISANNGDGHAWDDIYAGRGRGIIVGIKNRHYIQGAGWVFLPSPNLQPWNIRENVDVNGVIGTMVDYGAGGVPFNGATFDGRLLTGVANKGFILRGIGRYLNLKNINYGYQGIVDGGLKFINGFSENTRFKSAPYIGCVFVNSVNLTPFRFIKFGFKVFTFRGDGTGSQPARIELEVGATPIGSAGGETYHNESNTVVRDIGDWSKFATYTMTSTKTNAGNQSDMSQQYLTLDVSASQGHHFVYIMLGNIVHEYSRGSVYAVVVVNNIEFIN